MMAFILSMCIVLPITLLPQRLLLTFKCIDRIRSEQLALETGQWCARWLMWIIPFCHIECIPCIDPKPEPAIWVINHTSMLDAFVLLAVDAKLRGKNKRPIKVIYVRNETRRKTLLGASLQPPFNKDVCLTRSSLLSSCILVATT